MARGPRMAPKVFRKSRSPAKSIGEEIPDPRLPLPVPETSKRIKSAVQAKLVPLATTSDERKHLAVCTEFQSQEMLNVQRATEYSTDIPLSTMSDRLEGKLMATPQQLVFLNECISGRTEKIFQVALKPLKDGPHQESKQQAVREPRKPAHIQSENNAKRTKAEPAWGEERYPSQQEDHQEIREVLQKYKKVIRDHDGFQTRTMEVLNRFRAVHLEHIQICDTELDHQSGFRPVSQEEEVFRHNFLISEFVQARKDLLEKIILFLYYFQLDPEYCRTKASEFVLYKWFLHRRHILDPYPDDDRKKELAAASNKSMQQLIQWFINTRARKWQAMVEVAGITKAVAPRSAAKKEDEAKDNEGDDSETCSSCSTNEDSDKPKVKRKQEKARTSEVERKQAKKENLRTSGKPKQTGPSVALGRVTKPDKSRAAKQS